MIKINPKVLKRLEQLEEKFKVEKPPVFEFEYFDGTKEKAIGCTALKIAVESTDDKPIKAVNYERGEESTALLIKALCGADTEKDEYPILIEIQLLHKAEEN